MIKINLLPASVFEKQVVRKLIMVFGMLLTLIIAGGFGYRMTLNKALADKQAELIRTQAIEQQVLATEQQANDEKAKIGPIQNKVEFIRGVMAYNDKAPRLYEELARFTYEKIRYRSIDLNDSEMVIQAHAPSLADAGRYLLNLYRANHIFSQVSMDSVPQYSSNVLDAAEEQGGTRLQSGGTAQTPRRSTAFDFKVTCKLAQPLSPPSYSGGGAAPTGSAASAAAPAGGGGGYSPPPPSTGGVRGPNNQMEIPLP